MLFEFSSTKTKQLVGRECIHFIILVAFVGHHHRHQHTSYDYDSLPL